MILLHNMHTNVFVDFSIFNTDRRVHLDVITAFKLGKKTIKDNLFHIIRQSTIKFIQMQQFDTQFMFIIRLSDVWLSPLYVAA